MHTLHPTERLKSKKQIQELFEKGSSFYSHPIKILYLSEFGSSISCPLPQIAFIVPSKHFRRAVDRNWLKRRMREAYRLHKGKWMDAQYPASLAFIYIAKEKLSFQIIEKAVIKVFLEFTRKK